MNESRSLSRPAAPPPDGTAAALVEAGTQLFARHGYDGASVRAITQAAGANLGAVTYHFGSKRALYAAVLESRLGPLRDRIAEAALGPGDPVDRIEAALRAFFEHLRAHPEIPQLMLQETASGRTPPAPALRAVRGMLGIWSGLIEEGQRRGAVRKGDPTLMSISIVSQPVHLTLVGRLMAATIAVDAEDPSTRERVIEHAVEFVRAGLSAGGET